MVLLHIFYHSFLHKVLLFSFSLEISLWGIKYWQERNMKNTNEAKFPIREFFVKKRIREIENLPVSYKVKHFNNKTHAINSLLRSRTCK